MGALPFWACDLRLGAIVLAVIVLWPAVIPAQKPPDPEVGYVFPPGAARGTTTEVRLAGFDWTPDLEFFVLDPRIELQVEGPLSRHLMPEPPFPIGMRAYGPPPLPREVTARISIPADFPPGPVRWQVANANGASSTGIFYVGDGPEIVEARIGSEPQQVDSLPVTISGRLSRHEEVDRFRIRPLADGPVTCELLARRLGANFHGVIEIREKDGTLLADAVDSAGRDLTLTFVAERSRDYEVSVRDLNFRGHRGCVYRLAVTPGPRIVATVPAAGQRGTTREVELIGYGLRTGAGKLERVTRTLSFPAEESSTEGNFLVELRPGQLASFRHRLSDWSEVIEPTGGAAVPMLLEIPGAVTGTLDRKNPADRYRIAGKAGETFRVEVEARRIGVPLDVALAVFGPDGKELATSDDLPGTTDAGLEFTAPGDGPFDLVVSDLSGAASSPLNLYRLTVRRAEPDFALEVSQHWNVPVGEKSETTVKVHRRGGFAGPVALAISGLPVGISAPPETLIPADQTEGKLVLQSAADAPTGAGFVTITGTTQIGDRTLTRIAQSQAAGNLATRSPDENLVSSLLVASTLKPVVRIRPMETDERTVHRGTMHLAELAIERQRGFDGEVIVQMDSRQPVKFRQGIVGPDVIVPPGNDRVLYPCLVPDMAETTDAYRVLLVGMAQVPDASGRIRHLVSKMQADDASVAITVEGALLKISPGSGGVTLRAGEAASIPIQIARSAKLLEAVRLEVRPPAALAESLHAEPILVPAGTASVSIPMRLAPTAITNGAVAAGRHSVTIRATVLREGAPILLSEAARATPMDRDLLAYLKAGLLPVIAETTIPIEIVDDRK